MAGFYDHEAGTTYTCVDSHPDTLNGGSKSKDGKLFYLVEATCKSLKLKEENVCVLFVRKNKTIILLIFRFFNS